MGLVLGIDTSCYTTSVALVDTAGNLVADERQLLSVAEGERGLQQSAAVFQHLRNLPALIEKLSLRDRRDSVILVAASTRPRPVAESYMPVFMVSEGFARAMAEALQVPLSAVSHQEGHLMAGIWSAGGPAADRFLAVHLSGGTSELLLVERTEKTGEPSGSGDIPVFKVEKLGGTTDLHAGQFVDRIGVALGLTFPCGPELQKLAQRAGGELKAPSVVRGMDISFSGPESHLQRIIVKGEVPAAEIARAVEHCVAATMEKLIRRGMETTGIKDVLLVGGVAANNYLRQRLVKRLGHPSVGARLFFAEPRFSTDNAVGTALTGIKL